MDKSGRVKLFLKCLLLYFRLQHHKYKDFFIKNKLFSNCDEYHFYI